MVILKKSPSVWIAFSKIYVYNYSEFDAVFMLWTEGDQTILCDKSNTSLGRATSTIRLNWDNFQSATNISSWNITQCIGKSGSTTSGPTVLFKRGSHYL